MIILNRTKLIRLNKYVDGSLHKLLDIDSLSKYGHLSLICLYSTMEYISRVNGLALEDDYFYEIEFTDEDSYEYCTSNAMNNAAENGHYDIVKWLYYNRNEKCIIETMYIALDFNNFNIAYWILKNNLINRFDLRKIMRHAVISGNIDIIKWLYVNTTREYYLDTFYLAAEHGHLNTCKWLYENKFKDCFDLIKLNHVLYSYMPETDHDNIEEWLKTIKI